MRKFFLSISVSLFIFNSDGVPYVQGNRGGFYVISFYVLFLFGPYSITKDHTQEYDN